MNRAHLLILIVACCIPLDRESMPCCAAEPEPSVIVCGKGYGFYGEVGTILVHERRLYCEPSKDLRHGRAFNFKPATLPLNGRNEERRKWSQEVGVPFNLLLNAQGELIVGDDLTASGLWHAEFLPELSAKLKKTWTDEAFDEVAAFSLEHTQGVNGKRYVTLAPELESIHLGKNKQTELKVYRLIMTDDEKKRGFLWYNNFSGK
jgi:hypothetical protein